MRNTLLTSAALLGLALAVPAFAQDYGATPGPNDEAAAPPGATRSRPSIPPPHVLMREGAINPETGARPGHVPGVGESLPMSSQHSNILPSDTHSVIAPSLPIPRVNPNASPEEFLNGAMRALQQHKTGEAQEALERAETRELDHDVAQGISPNNDPLIGRIRAAREALGLHHYAEAQQQISGALTTAGNVPTGGMNGPMSSGGPASGNQYRTAEPRMAPGPEMNPGGEPQ
jgi:hypothetical protein